jgi:polyhydroxyalkanoate synthesis regulator protein
MQGFVGAYLEKNMQVFIEMQQKMTTQPSGASPEAWSQFLTMQGPMMHTVMTSYLDQTKHTFEQMQEQMQRSSEQMLAAMLLKR